MGSSRVFVLSLLVVVVTASGQYYDQTTPVPILKQINRHNEDGSYSYGYEGADGSYKIETKHSTGEVLGKYGYVDDTGSVREVEYGANKYGFQPAGTGINVAPPTVTNNNPYRSNAVGEDDGQYHEDPSVYYKDSGFNSAPQRPAYRPQTSYQQPAYNSQPSYQQPSYNSQPSYQQPAHNSQPSYQQPAHNYNYNDNYNNNYNPQPSYQQQPYYPKVDPDQFRGHPASNFDVQSGSYSVSYSG